VPLRDGRPKKQSYRLRLRSTKSAPPTRVKAEIAVIPSISGALVGTAATAALDSPASNSVTPSIVRIASPPSKNQCLRPRISSTAPVISVSAETAVIPSISGAAAGALGPATAMLQSPATNNIAPKTFRMFYPLKRVSYFLRLRITSTAPPIKVSAEIAVITPISGAATGPDPFKPASAPVDSPATTRSIPKSFCIVLPLTSCRYLLRLRITRMAPPTSVRAEIAVIPSISGAMAKP
jgi:hypothetical protein